MNPAPTPTPVRTWLRRHFRAALAVAGGLALAGFAVACSTTNNRGIVMPPAIPGATYVGSDACGQCHDQIDKNFSTSFHASLITAGPNPMNVGCESCHGPASVHVESGGAIRTIVNPSRNPESCFTCHTQLRSQFSLPNRHPVVEGRIGCSACHDPHRGDGVLGRASSLMSANDNCKECHKAQRGPHIFEHEALREGCTTCHSPHGSVNQKLLTERNAILCLKCHFQQQTGPGRIAIGAIDHTSFLSRGTCWSAGCHEAVHGSQVSASLRF